jgi:thiamine biosynthesis lipoprotein
VRAPPVVSEYRAGAVAVSRALLGAPIIPLLIAGAHAQSAESTHAYRYLMGTSIQIQTFGGDERLRARAIDETFAVFAEIDRLMSNYREDSELSAVNRRAAAQAVPVSDPLFSVFQAAQDVSERSNGAFDVTVGPLVALWGFHDKKPHIPTPTELATVRPLIGYRNVMLDADHHTIRFARAGMSIDLGGIAKGFAVELAGNVLRGYGLDGFIDAGGNQYLVGAPPGKRSWTVGIKSPDVRDRLLGAVDTTETSVSTSSNDANYLTVGNRTYGHILDPHTLQPSDAALSVTIFSRDGTLADALSKAAFVLGPRAGIELIDSIAGVSGVIAYRKPDGGVGLALSSRLGKAFHPS